MNNHAPMNIAAVERDTGVGKDTLRVWERRYGFPQPARDGKGERLYPAEQVARLHLVKRLLDQGYRPGRLLPASEEELLQLAGAGGPASSAKPPAEPAPATNETIAAVVRYVKSHDLFGLRLILNQALLRHGLQGFVLDTLLPINRAVGDAWMRGEIAVFEEHFYSEQIKTLLRQAIGNLPRDAQARPRILLTTVPDEQHALGLLMAECLFTLDGASCVSLGSQTPLTDIRAAAAAHRVDIVALSFSSAFSTRLLPAVLRQLRQLLPPEVILWAGGSTLARLPASAGVQALPTLEAALAALQAWRDVPPCVNAGHRARRRAGATQRLFRLK